MTAMLGSPARVGEPTVEEVVAAAADAFAVPVDELTGESRVRPLVSYRHATMAACRLLTAASYETIARTFGGRDHATVMTAVRRCTSDRDKAELLGRLLAAIGPVLP